MRETRFARPGAWRLGMILAVALALVAVVLAAQRPAEAHDHRVPDTLLKKGGRDVQVGRKVFESSWDKPAGGNSCVNQNVIYAPGMPEVDRVAAGSELRIRISKVQRPDSFEVTAYPRVNRDGNPAGQGRALRSTLEPVVEEGRTVAWDAVFSVNRAEGHYYLIAGGHWQDSQGCRNDQFAFWGFHVKTGEA